MIFSESLAKKEKTNYCQHADGGTFQGEDLGSSSQSAYLTYVHDGVSPQATEDNCNDRAEEK
jgi:hypothetical protein